MSYDLMVFEPSAAPAERTEFLKWYRLQMDSAMSRKGRDLGSTTPSLRALYASMIQQFPDMNGAGPPEDYDSPNLTDYDIGPHTIYVSFRWSVADDAYATLRAFAELHQVGFFDVSSTEEEIVLPTPFKVGNSMDDVYRAVAEIVPTETMDEVMRIMKELQPPPEIK